MDMIRPHCHGWAYETALGLREAFAIRGIPTDDDIERVLDGLQLEIGERDFPGHSAALLFDDVIILRPGLSREQRRWGTIHEVTHHLGHAGCQPLVPKALRWRQERQADVCTGFFFLPMRVLDDLHSPYEAAEACGVPLDRVVHWLGWLAS